MGWLKNTRYINIYKKKKKIKPPYEKAQINEKQDETKLCTPHSCTLKRNIMKSGPMIERQRIRWTTKEKLFWGRILWIFFEGEYITVDGGFGVSDPISDQILSKSCLTGPVWWEQCSFEFFSLLKLSYGACLVEQMFLRDFITLKLHKMFFFCSLFWSTLKVIKLGFAQNPGGIMQFSLY